MVQLLDPTQEEIRRLTGLPTINPDDSFLQYDITTDKWVAKSLVHTDITDFDTSVRANRLDQLAVPTSNISLNSNKITNLTDPTEAQDAATKAYVDSNGGLPSLPIGNIWIGSGSGTATARAITGDISLLTAGSMTINSDAVTFPKIQNISSNRFLGRQTSGGGNIEQLTGTQLTTGLDVFSSTLKGLVPLSGGGITNFLRADGTWAVPASGGVAGISSLNGLTVAIQTFTDGTFVDVTSSGTTHTIDLNATGTPSATTYLRGDNSWATITSGGSISAGAGLTLTGNVMSVNPIQSTVTGLGEQSQALTMHQNRIYLGTTTGAFGTHIRGTETDTNGRILLTVNGGTGLMLEERKDINNANVDVMVGSALVSTATTGFFGLNSMSGTPTGTPVITSHIPLIYNRTGNTLHAYNNSIWNTIGGLNSLNGLTGATQTFTNGTFIDITSAGTTHTVDLNATGTASATTFLRGDNSWATPAGGGSIVGGAGITAVTSDDVTTIDITSGVHAEITGLGEQTQALDLGGNNLLDIGTLSFGTVSTDVFTTILKDENDDLIFNVEGYQGLRLIESGTEVDTVIGKNAELAVSATSGHLHIPTCDGVPTGTPQSYNGKIPIIYDKANDSFFAYNESQWNELSGGGGGSGITSLGGLTGATQTFTNGTFIDITSSGTSHTIDLTATGTPSATTYLRGDNSWASFPSGNGITSINNNTIGAQVIAGGTNININDSGATHTLNLPAQLAAMQSITFVNRSTDPPTSDMTLYRRAGNWYENIPNGEFKVIRFGGTNEYVFSANSLRLQGNEFWLRDNVQFHSTGTNADNPVLSNNLDIELNQAIEYSFRPTELNVMGNNITNVGTVSTNILTTAATGGLTIRIGADNDYVFSNAALDLGGMALRNAPHSHTNALNGGTLGLTALSASGTRNNTTYLRGDNTWATITSGGSISAGDGLTLTGTVMSITPGVQSTITGLGEQSQALHMNDNSIIMDDVGGNNTEITVGTFGGVLNFRARGTTGISISKITDSGDPDIILGQSVLEVADTRGFVRINSVAGTPTGTPAITTGTPLIWNSAGNTLHVYSGSSWNTIGGASGITSLGGLTGTTQTFTNGTFIDITSAGTTHTIDLTATGTPSATTFLRGDNTWTTITDNAGITSLNAQTGGTQTFASGSGVTVASNSNIHTISLESSVTRNTSTQTLTNKTLTTPTIASFVNATHNHSTNTNGGQIGLNALTATGTPSATTFLRGDNSWAAVSSGGISSIFGGVGITAVTSDDTVTIHSTPGVHSEITGLGIQAQHLHMDGHAVQFSTGISSQVTNGTNQGIVIGDGAFQLQQGSATGNINMRIGTTVEYLFGSTFADFNGNSLRNAPHDHSNALGGGQIGLNALTATGTPSATTYLRGDNTWAAVSDGGSIVGGTGITAVTSNNVTTIDITSGAHSEITGMGSQSQHLNMDGHQVQNTTGIRSVLFNNNIQSVILGSTAIQLQQGNAAGNINMRIGTTVEYQFGAAFADFNGNNLRNAPHNHTNVLNGGQLGLTALSATGTASATTYLRGDNTWATLPTDNAGITSLGGLTGATQTFTNGTFIDVTSAGTSHTIDLSATGTPSATTYLRGDNSWVTLPTDNAGITSLNGLTGGTQTFTGVGNLNIASTGTVHTFSLSSNVVTLTGTQTLTNKTLTSPTLNSPMLTTPVISSFVNATHNHSTNSNGGQLALNALSATGTRSATTYLRGDNSWATLPTDNAGIHSLNGLTGGTQTFTDGTFVDVTSSGTTHTIDLSATGTPSATTFLRGDNTWAAASSGTIIGGTGITAVTSNGVSTINITSGVHSEITGMGSQSQHLEMNGHRSQNTTGLISEVFNSTTQSLIIGSGQFQLRQGNATGNINMRIGTNIEYLFGTAFADFNGNNLRNAPHDHSNALNGGQLGLNALSATGTRSATTFLRGDNTWVDTSGGSFGITSLNGLTGGTQTFTNGTFIDVTSTGTTHTIDLSVTGTPSANTFLRGDNTWATLPTDNAGIHSLNGLTGGTQTFTGAGNLNISSAGNVHTFSLSSSVATIAGTQTLTNKTLTTPTIASFVNATHDHSNNANGGLISGVQSGIRGLGVQTQNLNMGSRNLTGVSSVVSQTTNSTTRIINLDNGAFQLQQGNTTGNINLRIGTTVEYQFGAAFADFNGNSLRNAPHNHSNALNGGTLGLAALSATGTRNSTKYLRGDNTWATFPTDNAGITSLGGLTGSTQTFTDGTFIDVTSTGTTHTVDLSATGTPSATTFLRGDNTWGIPAGAGSGIESLNGLTGGTQTFTGSGGIGITSSGTTHTFTVGSSIVTLGGSQILTSKTLTTPIIASFVNATHNHSNNANGGQIGLNALTATGTRGATTYLRGDNSWATLPTDNAGIHSLNGLTGGTQTFTGAGNLNISSAGNVHTFSLSANLVTIGGSQTLTNKVLATPTIASFTNATHNHSTNANGGQLGLNALSATGTPSATRYLRGDNTWATLPTDNAGITSLGGLTGATQTFTNGTFIDVTSSGTTHTIDLSATGTASATTFLRGDNSWAIPAGAGSGIESLNGLTVGTQTFVDGANIGVTSSGSTHTFDLSANLTNLQSMTFVNDNSIPAGSNYSVYRSGNNLYHNVPNGRFHILRWGNSNTYIFAQNSIRMGGREIWLSDDVKLNQTSDNYFRINLDNTNEYTFQPTKADFNGNALENAPHNHSNALNGGTLGLNALSATGTASATTYLRGDNSWATLPTDNTGITSLGGLTGATQTFAGAGGLTISSSGTVHTLTAPSRIHNLSGQTGGTQTLAGGTGVMVTSNNNIHTFAIETFVVTTTGAQTLSNKVLTTPTVSSFINATHNHSTTATGGQIGLNALTATGTPSATTYLRGDNSWATVSGGGTPITAGTGLTLASNVMSITAGVQSTITGIGEQSQALDMNANNILDIGTLSFGTVSTDVFTTILKDENDDLIFNVAGYQGLRLVESGTEVDVIFGKNTEIALSATSGHIHIPTCDGVPTGTPQAYHGKIPIIYDKANDDLFAYNKSQWNTIGGGSGGIVSLGGLTGASQTFTDGTFIDIVSSGTTHTIDLTATGTPSSTTFLRGDNTWGVPPSGGNPSGVLENVTGLGAQSQPLDMNQNNMNNLGRISFGETDSPPFIQDHAGPGVTLRASGSKAVIETVHFQNKATPDIILGSTLSLSQQITGASTGFVRIPSTNSLNTGKPGNGATGNLPMYLYSSGSTVRLYVWSGGSGGFWRYKTLDNN